MAKFYGAVGFAVDQETAVDVIEERPVERYCKGDLVKNNRRLDGSQQINDDVTVSNQISIVADPYALSHFFAIRYVKWQGVAWKVTNVDVQTPRLILTLGGVYNGQTAN